MGENAFQFLEHIPTTQANVWCHALARDLLAARASRQGIGPMPTFIDDKNPSLVRCFDPPQNSTLSVYMLTSPQAHKRPEMRRSTDFLAPASGA
jgi:DNA-binding transcriptional LysR family regulator